MPFSDNDKQQDEKQNGTYLTDAPSELPAAAVKSYQKLIELKLSPELSKHLAKNTELQPLLTFPNTTEIKEQKSTYSSSEQRQSLFWNAIDGADGAMTHIRYDGVFVGGQFGLEDQEGLYLHYSNGHLAYSLPATIAEVMGAGVLPFTYIGYKTAEKMKFSATPTRLAHLFLPATLEDSEESAKSLASALQKMKEHLLRANNSARPEDKKSSVYEELDIQYRVKTDDTTGESTLQGYIVFKKPVPSTDTKKIPTEIAAKRKLELLTTTHDKAQSAGLVYWVAWAMAAFITGITGVGLAAGTSFAMFISFGLVVPMLPIAAFIGTKIFNRLNNNTAYPQSGTVWETVKDWFFEPIQHTDRYVNQAAPTAYETVSNYVRWTGIQLANFLRSIVGFIPVVAYAAYSAVARNFYDYTPVPIEPPLLDPHSPASETELQEEKSPRALAEAKASADAKLARLMKKAYFSQQYQKAGLGIGDSLQPEFKQLISAPADEKLNPTLAIPQPASLAWRLPTYFFGTLVVTQFTLWFALDVGSQAHELIQGQGPIPTYPEDVIIASAIAVFAIALIYSALKIYYEREALRESQSNQEEQNQIQALHQNLERAKVQVEAKRVELAGIISEPLAGTAEQKEVKAKISADLSTLPRYDDKYNQEDPRITAQQLPPYVKLSSVLGTIAIFQTGVWIGRYFLIDNTGPNTPYTQVPWTELKDSVDAQWEDALAITLACLVVGLVYWYAVKTREAQDLAAAEAQNIPALEAQLDRAEIAYNWYASQIVQVIGLSNPRPSQEIQFPSPSPSPLNSSGPLIDREKTSAEFETLAAGSGEVISPLQQSSTSTVH